MPWRETCVVDERARFVLAVEAGEEPVAALCRRFGISRRHGYKWLERWRAEGVAGLADRSRAPLHHPQAVAAELARGLPRRAPRASDLGAGEGAGLRSSASARSGRGRRRAPSARCFDREGLTVKRRLRRRAPPGGPLFAAEAANDVWTIDFKGWFRTGDGARVDPLTLADACSRYLLRCQAVARPDTEPCLADPRRRLPRVRPAARLRSDNGPPVRDRRRGRALAARGAGDQGRGHCPSGSPPASRRRTAATSGCT